MSESFARWKNYDECKMEQMEIGHVEADAKCICDGIRERAEKGLLFKASPSIEILKSKDDELIVAGPASWEIEDYEHDYVTTEAQVNFLKKFFSFPQEYRNVSIDHTNFQMAVALSKYPEKDPKYFSHVHEKGMWLIAKIRNDNMETTQKYRQLIKDGIYKKFSIAGKPLRCDGPCERNLRTEKIRKIFDVDPFEVAIVKEGMNPKAEFEILKGKCSPCINHFKQVYMEKGVEEKQAEEMATKLYERVYQRMNSEEQILQKPFADYSDWEACIADCHNKHPDVSDCEAWCGRIKAETEGKIKKFDLTVEQIFRKHFPEYKG